MFSTKTAVGVWEKALEEGCGGGGDNTQQIRENEECYCMNPVIFMGCND